MTSATIIQARPQWRQALPQPAGLPSLRTFVGQAVAGSLLAHFLLFVVPCLLSQTNWDKLASACLLLAGFLFLSLFAGVPAGCIIWACTRSDAGPVHWAYRCVIALLVLLPGWLYLGCLAFSDVRSVRLWLLAWLLVPAVTIGLLTHSRLRLGHELVRRGEAAGRVSRVVAAFSGTVLRVAVVLLFMETLVAVIYLSRSADRLDEQIWTALLCGHFAASLLVVFLRTNFALLATVAAAALAPLFIAFYSFPVLAEMFRFVVTGYVAVWVVFLLSRWRQTDFALSFLNEEIHYYLID